MGGCLSSKTADPSRSGSTHGRLRANVISANGDLHQYAIPLTVSQVLQMEDDQPITNSSSSSSSSFLCNSDSLYYDDYIPPLDAQHQLQPNQIYFVLPASKLQYRLTASDMAALAVKATLALQKSTTTTTKHSSSSSFYSYINRNRGHNKSARISPILLDHGNSTSTTDSSSSFVDRDNYMDEINRNGQTATATIKKKGIYIDVSGNKQQPAAALGVSKSGSVRKLQKYSSRRAKMAVRSFRIRLTTIYEESSVLQFS